ncbi:hypothetical protein GCM10027217_39980 [Pseudomaricurvus hydrocarbonicus]
MFKKGTFISATLRRDGVQGRRPEMKQREEGWQKEKERGDPHRNPPKTGGSVLFKAVRRSF